MSPFRGVLGAGVDGRLHDVTLEVPAGAITAVVGGDGAGKSTLLRLLVGALVPDEGVVAAPEDPVRIGYVPTGSGYYPDLTVAENLRFVATAYGLDTEAFRSARAEVLGLTGLGDVTDRLARDLSGGMRQKLALALGTLHSPELLVLDEPTTGVDPVSRAGLWRIIARAAAEGVHVVVATSYLDEAERAGTVLALHRGRTLLEGTPADLVAATPGAVLDLGEPRDRALAWRRGDRWRQWVPEAIDGVAPGAGGRDRRIEPALEDAVIVATLAATRGAGDGAGTTVGAP